MARQHTYRVKDVSRITRVSIRTLHYYDEIRLLVPTARSDAGYRIYTDDDLLRLQQILIGRELGLPLEDIRRLLDDPRFNRREALLAQRQQLEQRARQTAAMIAAVDAALALTDDPSTEKRMDQMFDGFDASKYEREAKERWGDTHAHEEAARRTKRYSKEDWMRMRAEQQAIYADLAALMNTGRAATDEEVLAVAERHRLAIDRWFYPCSPRTHRGLASLYESDARFAAAIDAHTPGLTMFLVTAIRAGAGRSPEAKCQVGG